MQVKRLQINAFRGIESLDLEFHPGANVLIGVNGAGKSTILDCLTALLLLANGDNLFSYLEDSIIKIGHSEALGEIGIEANDGQTQTIKIEIPRFSARDELGNSPIYVFGNEERITASVIYYPAQRSIPLEPFKTRETSPEKHSRSFTEATEVDSLLDLTWKALQGNTNFQGFFQWFKDCEDLENETRLETNPDHRDRQLEAIRNAIPIFLPGFSHLRIKRSPLRMVVTKNGQELIISQLSDGEKSLLTIIGDIARRLAICNPALEDPLKGEGIILIDEIDAHLHPKWQRGIIPKLERTFPNCQFFIATHSPQIISDVKSENIYLLQQDAAGEVIAVHPEGTYGRDTNQILEDVMGVSDRPEWSKQNLQQLFRLIDSGDLPAARDLKNQLESAIGIDEPEFAKADVLIRRKEILGR
jgi:predicted ATP-binding protein involved in virulence